MQRAAVEHLSDDMRRRIHACHMRRRMPRAAVEHLSEILVCLSVSMQVSSSSHDMHVSYLLLL